MKQEERTLHTKHLLANSLKRKMAEKQISKITVRELIEDCSLNRKTFYYHFEDIYALLKWMFEQEAFEVVKNFDMLLDLEDVIRFVMNYVAKNKHILNCALDSIGREDLKRFFVADFHDVIFSAIKATEEELGVSVPRDFEHFLTVAYTEALAGMLLEWIQARHIGAVSYITAEYISLFLRTSIPAVLMAAAENET